MGGLPGRQHRNEGHGGLVRRVQRHGVDGVGKAAGQRQVAEHGRSVLGRDGQADGLGSGVRVALEFGGVHRRTSRWKISRLSFFIATKLGSLSVASVRGRASA